MASNSVRNNTGLLKGDSSLSNIQEILTYSTSPLLKLMQKMRHDNQLTREIILHLLNNQLFYLVHLTYLFLQLDANNFITYCLMIIQVWLIMIVKLPANFCSVITSRTRQENVQKDKELLKRFQKIIFNRAPTQCQTPNLGHSGAGATPSTKELTNNNFTQKEELYSREIHN